jgi:hypothetical protein
MNFPMVNRRQTTSAGGCSKLTDLKLLGTARRGLTSTTCARTVKSGGAVWLPKGKRSQCQFTAPLAPIPNAHSNSLLLLTAFTRFRESALNAVLPLLKTVQNAAQNFRYSTPSFAPSAESGCASHRKLWLDHGDAAGVDNLRCCGPGRLDEKRVVRSPARRSFGVIQIAIPERLGRLHPAWIL